MTLRGNAVTFVCRCLVALTGPHGRGSIRPNR